MNVIPEVKIKYIYQYANKSRPPSPSATDQRCGYSSAVVRTIDAIERLRFIEINELKVFRKDVTGGPYKKPNHF